MLCRPVAGREGWDGVHAIGEAERCANKGVERALELAVGDAWAAKGDAADVRVRVLNRRPCSACSFKKPQSDSQCGPGYKHTTLGSTQLPAQIELRQRLLHNHACNLKSMHLKVCPDLSDG